MGVPDTGDVEDQAQRMREMIQRLDVDMLELAYAGLGGVFADASKVCASCENAVECSRWLNDAAERGDRPAFCPNLALFKRFATPEK